MRHRRFVSRLLNRPQLITPTAGAAVVAALLPGARLYGYDSGDDGDVQGRPSDLDYQVIGTTAVIPVVGEMVHRGGWMDAYSGLCSYQSLGDMVTDALNDPGVTGLVLDIDSPGGEAAGCLDFAEWLASMRGDKPMLASVNQLACSAAYAIASACDTVMIGADAHAGSIGAVCYHTDLSAALKDEGIKITYIFAGDRKIDGAPALPLSNDARDSFQADIDALYDRFCSVVAANRGMSVSAVQDTQAGIFRGVDAVSAGLADKIGTPEEAMMAVQPTTRSAPRNSRMAAEGAPAAGDDTKPPAPVVTDPPAGDPPPHVEDGQPGALPVDAPEERRPNQPASPGYGPADPVELAEACTNAGFPSLIAPLLRSRASMTAVQSDLQRASGIQDAATRLGASSMAADAIAGGVSLETFRRMATNMRAAAETPVSTAHTGVPSASATQAPISGREVNERKNAAQAVRH